MVGQAERVADLSLKEMKTEKNMWMPNKFSIFILFCTSKK